MRKADSVIKIELHSTHIKRVTILPHDVYMTNAPTHDMVIAINKTFGASKENTACPHIQSVREYMMMAEPITVKYFTD